MARVALGNHSVGSKEAGFEKRARLRTGKYPGLSPLHTWGVVYFTLVHLFLKTGFVCVHSLREGMAFCSEGIDLGGDESQHNCLWLLSVEVTTATRAG